jgi:hypothetical protein
MLENKPVASITLIKDDSIIEHDLFRIILERYSNKREYQNKTITAEKLNILYNELNKTCYLNLFQL